MIWSERYPTDYTTELNLQLGLAENLRLTLSRANDNPPDKPIKYHAGLFQRRKENGVCDAVWRDPDIRANNDEEAFEEALKRIYGEFAEKQKYAASICEDCLQAVKSLNEGTDGNS